MDGAAKAMKTSDLPSSLLGADDADEAVPERRAKLIIDKAPSRILRMKRRTKSDYCAAKHIYNSNRYFSITPFFDFTLARSLADPPEPAAGQPRPATTQGDDALTTLLNRSLTMATASPRERRHHGNGVSPTPPPPRGSVTPGTQTGKVRGGERGRPVVTMRR